MQSTILKQSIAENLETFRKHFPKMKKCYVSQNMDFIAYGYDDNRIARRDYLEANKLIERLKLPLVALYTHGSKSFYVQSSENSDI